MFGFVIVTVLMADTDPTCTLPNANEAGENVGFARIPVPVKRDRLGAVRSVVGDSQISAAEHRSAWD